VFSIVVELKVVVEVLKDHITTANNNNRSKRGHYWEFLIDLFFFLYKPTPVKTLKFGDVMVSFLIVNYHILVCYSVGISGR